MALRLGLMGRGRWGRNIEQTLLSFPDVSVVAIARGEARPVNLDGILVATPNKTHADVALPFIEAGVPTFIEKPLATNVADALRIRAAAQRSGAIVFVGHVHLYNPAFQAAVEIVRSLGEVHSMLCEAANDRPRDGESVLWDWLPHPLSMARVITGSDAASVEAWNLTRPTAPRAAVAKFDFGGVAALATVSWLEAEARFRATISCDAGTVVFDDRAQRRLAVYDTTGAVSHPPYDAEQPLARELAAFLQAIRSGTPDPKSIDSAVAIVRMIAAAEDSAARGGVQVTIAKE
jgi:predicted dehydrogenase